MKNCRSCGLEKDEEEFHFRNRAKGIRHSFCKQCTLTKLKDRISRMTPEQREVYKRNDITKQKRRRLNRATAILVDSKSSDRKRGLYFNLTRGFVESAISKPCSYCEDTDCDMTLDRIDNRKGHSMDNVVPSCARCNMIRRDMPYEAWLVVSRGMKKARVSGLFGDWTGTIHHKRLASRKGIEPL